MEDKVEKKAEGESKKRLRSISPVRAELSAPMGRPLTPQEVFLEYFTEKTRNVEQLLEAEGLLSGIKLKRQLLAQMINRKGIDWAKTEFDKALNNTLRDIDPTIKAENEARFKRQAIENELATSATAAAEAAEAINLENFKRVHQTVFDRIAGGIRESDVNVIGKIGESGARKHWNDEGVDIENDDALIEKFLKKLRASKAECAGRDNKNRNLPSFTVGEIGPREFNYAFSYNATTGKLNLYHAGPGG